ncbi:MAG: hypothetical protein K2X46_06740 [Roseomonas sp.]|nr:hypothetical protein [Roseomonas sp.]
MDWIKAQLAQPSTLRGVAYLLSLAGVTQADGIVANASIAVGALVGIWDIVRKGRDWSAPGA